MKIATLKCRDCGEVLNQSHPFEDKDEGKVRLSSGLAAGPCPKGCRSTEKDLNLNTTLEITPFIDITQAEVDQASDDKQISEISKNGDFIR